MTEAPNAAPLPSEPAPQPVPRKDKRPTLTVKGDEFGIEFRKLINKAAERSGLSQAKWVAEVLTREAHRVVSGGNRTPSDSPGALPAVLPAAVADQRFEEINATLRELAAGISRITPPSNPSSFEDETSPASTPTATPHTPQRTPWWARILRPSKEREFSESQAGSQSIALTPNSADGVEVWAAPTMGRMRAVD
jgi:hypothetical protein